jgi:hypothetical protein
MAFSQSLCSASPNRTNAPTPGMNIGAPAFTP